MFGFYILGVFVCLIINLIKLAINVSQYFSNISYNYSKIEIYYDFFTASHSRTVKTSFGRFSFYLFYMFVLTPLFSWLSVVSAAYSLISSRVNKVEVPEEIKKIRFKLSTQNLSKNEVFKLENEAREVMGIQRIFLTKRGDEIDSDPFEFLLDDDDGWVSKVSIEPDEFLLHSYGRTPDYDSIFHSISKYRVNDGKLECKLLEDWSEHWSEEEWNVRNNTVLESEIKERYENSRFNLDSVEEKIERYTNQIDWHEVENFNIKYFILSRHQGLMPKEEFLDLVRNHYYQYCKSMEKALDSLKLNGFVLLDTEEGTSVRFPEKISDEEKERFQSVFDKIVEPLNLTSWEIGKRKLTMNSLERWLRLY